MISPIFDMEVNKLTSLKGEVSFIYEVTPPDIDQMNQSELSGLHKSIINSFAQIDAKNHFKIYSLDKNIYMSTDKELVELPSYHLSDYNLGDSEQLSNLYSDIEIKEDYFLLNGKFFRLLSLKEFPTEIEASELMGLGDYVVNFKKIESESAKSKLNLKRRMHFSFLMEGIRNIDSENAYNESEELLENITTNNESLFNVELFFIVNGLSKENLEENTKILAKKIKNIEGEVRIEAGGLSYFLMSIFPGVTPSFKRSHLVPGEYVAFMLPYHKDHLMDDGIEFKSASDSNVCFNIFNRNSHNFNCLVTGSSGQGKSMLANNILNYEIDQGRSAVVLDLGNSFKKNVLFHDGAVLSERINPLQFKDPIYLKEFILSIVDEKWTNKKSGKLLSKIKEFDFDNHNYFQDLIKFLEEDFDGISYYFEDLWPFFTDSELELNTLTYCDFSNYPEKIKAPIIIYLIEHFKHLKGEKIFLFDECWHLLERNAGYIAECFRTFRKHDASAIAISQNIDDFVQTTLGRVIIQNTFYKIFFRQYCVDGVFLEREVKEIISDLRSEKGRYSEFLVHYEGAKKVCRYYPSPFEYELFTSDKKDNQMFEDYFGEKGRFFDFKTSLENFVLTKYPYLGRDPYGY